MKIRLTEEQFRRIILREQLFPIEVPIEALLDPSNTSFGVTDDDYELGRVTKSKERVKELFEKVSQSPIETDSNKLEDIKYKVEILKNSMEGIGTNARSYLIDALKDIKTQKELSTLINKWEEYGETDTSLYDWFAAEYTISWDKIWKALEPKFKGFISSFNYKYPTLVEQQLSRI
tara:strand:+ start:153 stop:680 length:528 start_codon:yes stop_codon:yes gene_type:complete